MAKIKKEYTVKGQRKKKSGIVLGAIAIILVTVIVSIGIVSANNTKAMNNCIDAVLAELEENYTLTPCDTGNYKEMNIMGPVKFYVEQYEIEELGNLSVMRVNMGVMQMATVVITPKEKNMPLLSADYMYILSNRKSYLEFYDVVKEKDEQYNQLLTALSEVQNEYAYLEDIEASEAWYEHLLTVTSYKAGTVASDKDLQGLLVDSMEVYLEHSKELPLLSQKEETEKMEITIEYTDGLIEKGGISTDVFKNALGEEETKKFFDNVFFGTKR